MKKWALLLLLGPGAWGRTILAVGAHAGDMELTCGAALERAARAGDRVVLLHLSLGERGKPGVSAADYGAQKKREALEAARALGAEARFGPWMDGDVPSSDEAARWIAGQIRDIGPSLVIAHPSHSIHKDHASAHTATVNAVLFAAIEGTRTVRSVLYAENWEDAEDFKPYVYVAVDEAAEAAWRKAVLSYEFTHAAFSGFDYVRYYDGLRRVRGAESRKGLAVAFDVEPMSKRRVVEALP